MYTWLHSPRSGIRLLLFAAVNIVFELFIPHRAGQPSPFLNTQHNVNVRRKLSPQENPLPWPTICWTDWPGCGIGIFGVPGDYNLQFLDHVIDHPTLRWVGMHNERTPLTANGYARMSGAGRYSPPLAWGGKRCVTVSRAITRNMSRSCISSARPVALRSAWRSDAPYPRRRRFFVFIAWVEAISVASAILDEQNACFEIDRVLGEMLAARAGYIMLPADVAKKTAITRLRRRWRCPCMTQSGVERLFVTTPVGA